MIKEPIRGFYIGHDVDRPAYKLNLYSQHQVVTFYVNYDDQAALVKLHSDLGQILSKPKKSEGWFRRLTK